MRMLGYLDELNHFFEDDDHDLMARAFVLKGWVAGFLPVHVIAPLEMGARRKPKPPKPKSEVDYINARHSRIGEAFLKKALLLNLSSHDDDRRLSSRCGHSEMWWRHFTENSVAVLRSKMANKTQQIASTLV
jgi:hypothetical protein